MNREISFVNSLGEADDLRSPKRDAHHLDFASDHFYNADKNHHYFETAMRDEMVDGFSEDKYSDKY